METLTFLMTSIFYPPYHLGGDALHVKYLAEELVKRGHDVHVLHSLDAYGVKRKMLPRMIEPSGVHLHVIKTRLNFSSYEAYVFGKSPAIIKAFEALVKETRPDVVHHHNISLLGYDVLKKVGDYLSIYTAHDFWLICQNSVLLKNGRKLCGDKKCLHCALSSGRLPQVWRRSSSFAEGIREIDFLVAPSQYMKTRLLKEVGFPRVAVIPNFVPQPPDKTSGSSELSDFFLFAGRLERCKGILELLDSYEGVDSKLVVVGEGPLMSEIGEVLNAKRLNSRVSFLGYVDRGLLYQLLADANALIMPSVWPENCPLVALEALSVGTPVISSNRGGLPEIVSKIDKDLVYDNPRELRRILSGFDSTKYSTHAVRAMYEQYYSPEAFMRKYFNLVDGSC
jgi:glycosyltransferase involved in cell wall biosynthesis